MEMFEHGSYRLLVSHRDSTSYGLANIFNNEFNFKVVMQSFEQVDKFGRYFKPFHDCPQNLPWHTVGCLLQGQARRPMIPFRGLCVSLDPF